MQSGDNFTQKDFEELIVSISTRLTKNSPTLVVYMVDEKDGVLKDMTKCAQFSKIMDRYFNK